MLLSLLASLTISPLDHEVYEDKYHISFVYHFILRGLENTSNIINSW